MKYVIKTRLEREIIERIINLDEINFAKIQETILNPKIKMFKVGDTIYSKSTFVSLEPCHEPVKVSKDFRLEEPKRDETSIQNTLEKMFYKFQKEQGMFKNFQTYEQWVESRNVRVNKAPVFHNDIDVYRKDWTNCLEDLK